MVFANSTCFGDELMGKLAQGAAALKEGAIVVTMTDPIPSPAFEVLEEVSTKESPRVYSDSRRPFSRLFSARRRRRVPAIAPCAFGFVWRKKLQPTYRGRDYAPEVDG